MFVTTAQCCSQPWTKKLDLLRVKVNADSEMVLSPKWNLSTTLSQAQAALLKRGWKDFKSQKIGRDVKKHCLSDTSSLLQP